MPNIIITPEYSYTSYAVNFGAFDCNVADAQLEGVEFDMLIGTGFSGGLTVPVLARHRKVDWALVRKDGENSHRERKVEGTRMGQRVLFVDDFVSSGSTLERVMAGLADFCDLRDYVLPEFVGVYEYGQNRRVYTPADQVMSHFGVNVRKAMGRDTEEKAEVDWESEDLGRIIF